jgi:dihydrofolate reductase
MTITAILACDINGGIARQNTMPWPKNKLDLQFFSQTTKNKTIVMGTKTWFAPDMPAPLPKRHNIVLTTNANFVADGATILLNPTISEIETLDDDLFVIGGASVIKFLFPIIDVFLLTRIAGDWDCDTYLPLIQIENDFKLISTVKLDNITQVETYIKGV